MELPLNAWKFFKSERSSCLSKMYLRVKISCVFAERNIFAIAYERKLSSLVYGHDLYMDFIFKRQNTTTTESRR